MYRRESGWKERKEQREARWQQHMAAWKQSGVKQAAYCRRQDLKPADFSWWKRELVRRGNKRREPEAAHFVPVQMINRVDEAAYEVELSNGRRLRIGRSIEPEQAAKMAAALEAVGPC